MRQKVAESQNKTVVNENGKREKICPVIGDNVSNSTMTTVKKAVLKRINQ
jgi:hypothetical protein